METSKNKNRRNIKDTETLNVTEEELLHELNKYAIGTVYFKNLTEEQLRVLRLSINKCSITGPQLTKFFQDKYGLCIKRTTMNDWMRRIRVDGK
jgi:ubiquinone biosynthesis protein Coq4